MLDCALCGYSLVCQRRTARGSFAEKTAGCSLTTPGRTARFMQTIRRRVPCHWECCLAWYAWRLEFKLQDIAHGLGQWTLAVNDRLHPTDALCKTYTDPWAHANPRTFWINHA